MAAVATFTYNGTDTVTMHVTGATVGHTITMYVQDDNWASNESVVAPSASFDFVYPGSVSVTPAGEKRFVYAWDDNVGKQVIGSTIFAIDSGSGAQYSNSVEWDYDGVNIVTVSFATSAAVTYALDTQIGDFDEYHTTSAVSPGGWFTLQLTTATHTQEFMANAYTAIGPFNVWGARLFTPGVAGEGIPGNPNVQPAGVIVTLDSVDVTNCCVAGNWTRRLNRPSTAQIRVPMDCTVAPVGSILKIEALVGTTYEIVHHGRVLNVETDTGEDFGYTTYNSSDPMEMWQWRPVRADDGDFTKPVGSLETNGNDLFATYRTGPQIVEAILKNTEGDSTAQGNPALTPPADAEGPTFLTFGSFATGGVDLSGAPVDWPMTIAELTSLLVSTGEVDIVITPTDPGGGIMGTVAGYNGRYGTDLSGSIVFSYGMGDYNVRRVRWNQDMTSVVNKLWYYGGPRVDTAADPAGDQHWCWNITGDDPAFNPDGIPSGAWTLGGSYVVPDTVTNLTPSVTFICILGHVATAADEPGVGANWQTYWAQSLVAPGGRNSPPASSTNNPLGVKRIASQGSYGVRMDIQIFDAYDDDCVPGFGTPGRNLYRKRWQTESWLRADPRELIHITPTRGTEIGTFDIGDLVTVEATAAVRGGFTGVQRVYEYTVSWDQDGVLELSELQTSADNEGL